MITRDIRLRPAASRLREVSHASIAKLLLFKHLLQAHVHVRLLIGQMHMAPMRHTKTGKVENSNALIASEFQLKQGDVQMHGSLHLELAAERHICRHHNV